MSMKVFMIIKFIEIFLCVSRNDNRPSVFCDAYTTEKTADDGKLLMSFLVGNFYLMNLVFLLQLLHISNDGHFYLGL